jgi:hypothetical protein
MYTRTHLLTVNPKQTPWMDFSRPPTTCWREMARVTVPSGGPTQFRISLRQIII